MRNRKILTAALVAVVGLSTSTIYLAKRANAEQSLQPVRPYLRQLASLVPVFNAPNAVPDAEPPAPVPNQIQYAPVEEGLASSNTEYLAEPVPFSEDSMSIDQSGMVESAALDAAVLETPEIIE
jgi:hypothetical protein